MSMAGEDEAQTEASCIDAEQITSLIEAAGVDGAREILSAFERSTDNLLRALQQELASGDLEAARRTAHALKGSALNVGAVDFAHTARTIEDACRQADAPLARERLPATSEQYQLALGAFGRLFARCA